MIKSKFKRMANVNSTYRLLLAIFTLSMISASMNEEEPAPDSVFLAQAGQTGDELRRPEEINQDTSSDTEEDIETIRDVQLELEDLTLSLDGAENENWNDAIMSDSDGSYDSNAFERCIENKAAFFIKQLNKLSKNFNDVQTNLDTAEVEPAAASNQKQPHLPRANPRTESIGSTLDIQNSTDVPTSYFDSMFRKWYGYIRMAADRYRVAEKEGDEKSKRMLGQEILKGIELLRKVIQDINEYCCKKLMSDLEGDLTDLLRDGLKVVLKRVSSEVEHELEHYKDEQLIIFVISIFSQWYRLLDGLKMEWKEANESEDEIAIQRIRTTIETTIENAGKRVCKRLNNALDKLEREWESELNKQ
ncbi:uncharacterized protein VICG_00840 [Vittaforma corneae ATCC 50505]|uniref:Uncharacterized protein n=1 Tax=Vittaforma corneae (strain ATCC 50505) TaxID=993615 RepID=L2GPG8_VITCO|nr:uncharacterized protein VICG_00840 [Vittaforma corneae ATCC 50505]ELA42197.1 hypothetical protein VICG_00840 [Vittaforma corneae ATCC 50505]